MQSKRNPGKSKLNKITIAGLERRFLVSIPESYSPNKKYSLLLALHGNGSTGRFMETLTGFSQFTEKYNLICVYPYGLEQQWNDSRPEIKYDKFEEVDDVKFILEMIQYLKLNFSIDQNKIHAAGISNGGIMSLRLAFELNGLIKGIAMVSAGFPKSLSHFKYKNDFEIITINGTKDPIIPHHGGIIKYKNKKMGKVLSHQQFFKHLSLSPPKQIETIPHPDFPAHIQNLNSHLKFITITNAGHTWPGSSTIVPANTFGPTPPFPATQTILEFFFK